jgi:uncharacterized surface protein with fasciclin (FAS1) repeats
MRSILLASIAAVSLAAAGCDRGGETGGAPDQPAQAEKAAGGQTIAAGLAKDGRFTQAAQAAGLDGTLAGPGPYTVLVPRDEAFAKVEGVLADAANPQNRAELTRILTYHILPGTVLEADLAKAVEDGKGKALIGTMNGETLTASREGGKLVLADGAGAKATIVDADQKRSNGVVHVVDTVLTPGAPAEPAQQ